VSSSNVHPRDIAMRAEQPDYEAIRESQEMLHNPMHKLFERQRD
jgi:hypothetical protein